MTVEMFMLLQQQRLERDVKRTGGPVNPIDRRPEWFKRVDVKLSHGVFSTPIPPKQIQT